MTLDLTGIAISIIGGVFSIIAIVATALINARLADKQTADTLDKALTNALGAMQQSAEQSVLAGKPSIRLPGSVLSPQMAVGVQYVLDHAGDEAARHGLDAAAIADKINARIGLAKIAAVSAQPMAPLPIPPPTLVPRL